ncbi:GNAT family protein [Streptomyces sp. G-G2]|uniref:GNAT family N-acetyltransferase n=1 Tax=Streptomyces sp. G-G2 TaxID=3046201 RepID=UPI0024BAD0B7|nr:GNAT family protein [Streptomyces sp. G-G2]MDJ0384758.1 GNAT family protein [Streptomyces sp. G-G2]
MAETTLAGATALDGSALDGAVALRPVTAADLDRFEAEFAGPHGPGPYQWFGHTPTARPRQLHAERGLLGGDENMLSVTVGDTLAGRVEWFRRSWGRVDTSACWEIGIGLFTSARGRGTGTRAQRLLVEYLFEHTRVERIQVCTDADNIAEQRAAEKAGFELEGRIRRAQWRAGAWHDQLIYSILRAP